MGSQTFISRTRLKDFDPSAGFDRGAGKIKETLWYLTKTLIFLSAVPYPSSLKTFLLRLFGATIGKSVVIKPRVNIHFPWKLVIGDFVWLGEEAFILNFEEVRIGSNASISQRAFLCGGNHDYLDPAMAYRNAPIIIEDGAWVGAQSFIGPGVTVGCDSVISAGSVLTRSCEPNGIYAGNPAQFIKKRWRDEELSGSVIGKKHQ